ncbi:hypothetical protein V8C42DRAFT_159278 [Trichoderma barbatum]
MFQQRMSLPSQQPPYRETAILHHEAERGQAAASKFVHKGQWSPGKVGGMSLKTRGIMKSWFRGRRSLIQGCPESFRTHHHCPGSFPVHLTPSHTVLAACLARITRPSQVGQTMKQMGRKGRGRRTSQRQGPQERDQHVVKEKGNFAGERDINLASVLWSYTTGEAVSISNPADIALPPWGTSVMCLPTGEVTPLNKGPLLWPRVLMTFFSVPGLAYCRCAMIGQKRPGGCATASKLS